MANITRKADFSEEDKKYLNERGFSIKHGDPPRDQSFPYVVLGDEEETKEIRYKLTRLTNSVPRSVPDVPNIGVEKLADMIEEIVVDMKDMNGRPRLFSTKKGEPIPVYLLPNAHSKWEKATKILKSRFK